MSQVFKGLNSIEEFFGKRTQYLTLKSGESKLIRFITPVDEIISIFEHSNQFAGHWRTVPCLGKEECPLCQAGERASLRLYTLVIDREDDTIKLFKLSKTVGQQLKSLIEEYGDITKRDFKVYRQGEKTNTSYQFFPKDPTPVDLSKYDIPNLEELIKFYSKEEIEKMMDGNDIGNDFISANIDPSQVANFPF
jgi:hypothetical protein